MSAWPFHHQDDDAHGAPVQPVARPGAGMKLTASDAGWSYSALAPRVSFPHPFKPMLTQRGVRFTRGLIDSFTPKIGKVKIGGDTEKGLADPILKLDPSIANDDGESFCCVEVEPDGDGKLTKDSRVEIVHVKEVTSIDPKIGRVALAMIVWKNKRPLRALEIALFNMRYQRLIPPAGGGAVRHIFY